MQQYGMETVVFGYVHIHSRPMASSKQRYFRRSNTHTCRGNTGQHLM
uniref:Uncharacterized protein n=1 Tax=Anguilla anguilla TaxID=7936 RepID=A0A0E9RV29_ANGAN